MKVTKRIGRGFKSLVDFPRWMGWGQIKSSAKQIEGLAKVVMSTEKPKHKETFEEAIRRLNLSEEDIRKQTSRHFWITLIFAAMTIAMFVYSFYLLFTHHYQGFLLGIFVSVLTCSLTFREHFYYFQMKTRRLGCSFQDWVNFVSGRAQK